MNNIIAKTAQTAYRFTVTITTKVLVAFAITAQRVWCFVGGFVVGRLITRNLDA